LKKKVLTINECYSDNLGDQAIAKSLNTLLIKQGYEVEQADYTGNILKNNSQFITQINNVTFKNKTINLVKKIEVFRLAAWCFKSYKRLRGYVSKEFDFAIIGGGQLILNNAHFPFALFLWTYLIKQKKRDIYLFAVGCGDSFTPLNKYLIARSLKRVKGVFVRDEASQIKLQTEFNVLSEVIPDVAYAYPVSNLDIIEKKLYVIVGIVDYDVFKRYAGEVGAETVSKKKYMQLWLDKILDHGFDNILLLATTYTDLVMSKQLYKYIQNKPVNIKVEFVDKLLSLEEYCNHLSKAEKIFSGRMHSLILGERFGCQPCAWPISKKILAYEAEQEKRVSINNVKKNLTNTIKDITAKYCD
jgi:polysaccharide pyruvyl transferase WcaK-like protein